ncbi:NADPH:quinone oxidoreductase family protein [Actinosynnema sp. NPDC020468]|uniref:quinone oxidoreductase family protein n=1 Tax=Actinosynnema sp. NPDC020468 TaxID=3154488 RepID=UPI0033E1E39F
MRAVHITRFGGPEVLTPVDLPEPTPGPGEVVVTVEACGVNFMDVHRTSDTYLNPTELPHVPGGEVVGRTPDGLRVIALMDGGGYAEKAVADHRLVAPVPDDLDAARALALGVPGLSAWHLLRGSARLRAGETVVINGASGGVGTIAVQLAKLFGAGRVIAAASTKDKRALARDLGADVTIDGSAPGYADRVLEANGGNRVDVVLDPIGGAVFDAALDTLASTGRMVTYGATSMTMPTPLTIDHLITRNISITGFWLTRVTTLPHMYREPLARLHELALAKRLVPVIGGTYPLAEAHRAHEALLSRRTQGKLVLIP